MRKGLYGIALYIVVVAYVVGLTLAPPLVTFLGVVLLGAIATFIVFAD